MVADLRQARSGRLEPSRESGGTYDNSGADQIALGGLDLQHFLTHLSDGVRVHCRHMCVVIRRSQLHCGYGLLLVLRSGGGVVRQVGIVRSCRDECALAPCVKLLPARS